MISQHGMSQFAIGFGNAFLEKLHLKKVQSIFKSVFLFSIKIHISFSTPLIHRFSLNRILK